MENYFTIERIVVIILCALLIYYLFKNNKEHFSDSEALNNIASMYNNQQLTTTNMKVSGQLNSGQIQTTTLNNQNIQNLITTIQGNNQDIQKMNSFTKFGAYANANNVSMLLLEGQHTFNDSTDLMYSTSLYQNVYMIYLFKGWKIDLWHDGNTNVETPDQTFTNTTHPIKNIYLPDKGMPIGPFGVQMYSLTWVGI